MKSYKEFEKLIAYYCAPTLVGIKPANLLACKLEMSVLEQQMIQFQKELSTSSIGIKLLSHKKSLNILFIYNIPLLEKQLSNSMIQSYLTNLGYPCNLKLDEMLQYLSFRIHRPNEYPHEIGLFLGYPYEDVLDFIKHHGKHYKFCGYWKVYTNEKETLELFEKYSRCRTILFQQVIDGFTLRDLHILYSSQTNELHKNRLE